MQTHRLALGPRAKQPWTLTLLAGLLLALPDGAMAQPRRGAPAPLLGRSQDLRRVIGFYKEQADYRTPEFVTSKLLEMFGGEGVQLYGGSQEFIRTPDGRRYLAPHMAAGDILSHLPKALQKHYAREVTVQGDQALKQARQAPTVEAYRQIRRRYPASPAEPASLARQADLHFDRGQTGRAIRLWREALDQTAEPDERAALLARLAVAWHVAGQAKQADAAQAELATLARQQDLQCTWAGEQRDPLAYVRQLRLGLPADTPARPTEPVRAELAEALPNVRSRRDYLAWQGVTRSYTPPQYAKHKPHLARGHLFTDYMNLTRGKRLTVRVPPLVHPVLTDQKLIYRDDAGLVARDADTGKVLWRAELPTWRQTKRTRFGLSWMGDGGHYRITLADGRAFVRGDFLPPIMPPSARPGVQPVLPESQRNTSVLAAIDVQTGKELWRIDPRKDAPKGLEEVKFVSPVNTDGQRAFVLTLLPRGAGFALACLDAGTGKLHWVRPAGALPNWRTGPIERFVYDAASPPLAVDGYVYLMTNAGLIGCYRQTDGAGVWFYQYDSPLTGAQPWQIHKMRHRPASDLAVAGGCLIAGPLDSDDVLAVHLETGQPVWKASRDGLARTTVLDEHTLLLTGPAVKVLSAWDGTALAHHKQLDVLGRPASSPDRVWLSAADGTLVQLSRSDWTVRAGKELPAGAVLGNLSVANNRLAAANAAGVSLYRIAPTEDETTAAPTTAPME